MTSGSAWSTAITTRPTAVANSSNYRIMLGLSATLSFTLKIVASRNRITNPNRWVIWKRT